MSTKDEIMGSYPEIIRTEEGMRGGLQIESPDATTVRKVAG